MGYGFINNMQLKKLLRHTIVKTLFRVINFLIIGYLVIVSVSMLITGFLFINLDSYKSRIEKVIYRHTGYQLSIAEIKPSTNIYYQPKLIINGIKLTNPANPTQSLKIKKLTLVLSYSTFWSFQPIFSSIKVDNTKLNLQITKNNHLLLNGIDLFNPDKKIISNTKYSSIDIEAWLLKQQNVQFINTDFSFTDLQNNLQPFQLNNIKFNLHRTIFHQHQFNLVVKSVDQHIAFNTSLVWRGGKLEDIRQWRSAKLQQQLVVRKPGKPPKVETALDAKLSGGKLISLKANFDIKDFKYLARHNNNVINLPVMGGSLSIQLKNKTHYDILASNLTISTQHGYILNNKQISGFYDIDQKGQISIKDTNLSQLNNFLLLFPRTERIRPVGNISDIEFSWLGSIFTPSDYTLSVIFNQLGLFSSNDDVPSIDNLSGHLIAHRKSGSINLQLDKSTLTYKKVFLSPYYFKHLNTTINWQVNPNKGFTVTLPLTQLYLRDFDGTILGSYTYEPKTHGFLFLKAYLKKINIHKVGDYLPAQIGEPVHKWLHNALVDGYGENGTMLLSGPISAFPFHKGEGKFYIDADIKDTKLRYADDWPTLDHIYGKFHIRNQKIIIEAESAEVNNNRMGKSLVVIPDMTAKGAYLVADGTARGSTKNFLEFLKHSPVNKMIGRIPEKATLSKGNGDVKLHLYVPFDNPDKTTVAGNYNFYQNTLKLAFAVPKLTNINGQLDFTNQAVTIKQMQMNAMGSSLTLTANTGKNNIINFKVNSSKLNYEKLAEFYMPVLAPLMNGYAATFINFEVDKSGIKNLTASSNLYGVAIDIPDSFGKAANTKGTLLVKLASDPNNHLAANFNYNNLITGHIVLNQNSEIIRGKIKAGTREAYISPNHAIMTANLMMPKFHLFDWLKRLTALVGVTAPTTPTHKEVRAQPIIADTTTTKVFSSLPIDILLNTDNFYLGDLNVGKTNANVFVTRKNTLFNLSSPQLNGYGMYAYEKNDVNIHLYNLKIYNNIQPLDADLAQNPESQAVAANPNTNISLTTKIATNNDKKNVATTTPAPTTLSITPIFTPIVRQNLEVVPLSIPTVYIDADKLTIQNSDTGKVHFKMRSEYNNLYIDNTTLKGDNLAIKINATNYCAACNKDRGFVDMFATVKIADMGKFLTGVGMDKVLDKGREKLNANIQWNGGFSDFSFDAVRADIKGTITSGKFLKVSNGGFLGAILGILNLQTIVSIAKLNFGAIFGNGFYFSTLKFHSYLADKQFEIKYLTIDGPSANVESYGNINLNNGALDMYMVIKPQLRSDIALGAGIATLNPIIGPIVAVIVYAIQWIFRDPFNKLFSFSYRITGTIQKPITTQVRITKQILNNIKAAIGNDEAQNQIDNETKVQINKNVE